jgi:ribosomal protein S18 acetylase RimI-like enzyme
VELDHAIELVAAWYAERNLPALLLEPDGCAPAGLGDRLVDRGWSARSETHVMTGEIAHLLRSRPAAITDAVAAGLTLRVDEAPDESWYACAVDGGRPASAAAQRVIEVHPNVLFASLRDGDRAVAVARSAVDARWAVVFMVKVEPDRRRQGLGAAITLGALKEAARRGGRHVYLQVMARNVAAVELYRRLNLRVHHNYRYWTSAPD